MKEPRWRVRGCWREAGGKEHHGMAFVTETGPVPRWRVLRQALLYFLDGQLGPIEAVSITMEIEELKQ